MPLIGGARGKSAVQRKTDRAYYQAKKGKPRHYYKKGNEAQRQKARKAAISEMGAGYKGGKVPRFNV